MCASVLTRRPVEVKALCQFPFSSPHSFPPLLFLLKKNSDLRKLDPFRTDWPQLFPPMLPGQKEEWRV